MKRRSNFQDRETGFFLIINVDQHCRPQQKERKNISAGPEQAHLKIPESLSGAARQFQISQQQQNAERYEQQRTTSV